MEQKSNIRETIKMNINLEKKYDAKAFVSCSLRQEDKSFIDYIERILDAHNIKPFGTVGKYSASPENPVELMKKNIPDADFVVIVATPRYLQKDLKTGEISYGLSEMIHVETGIAYAFGKPVVVFIQEGTNIGNFLPSITQYITLNGQKNDFLTKRGLISDLLNNTYFLVKKLQEEKTLKTVGKVVVGGLAIYGLAKLLQAIFGKK